MNKHKNEIRELWFFGAGNTAMRAFLWLRKHEPGIDLLVCSPAGERLAAAAQSSGVRWTSLNDPAWRSLEGTPTILVSFLFPYHVPSPLISKSQYGGVNFHPAPLPSYRGVRCATFAILNNAPMFGVTCHYMTDRFDDGPILAAQSLPLLSNDTAYSLEKRCKDALLKLFARVFSNRTWESSPPEVCEHLPPGILYTQEMFDRMARIEDIDTCDLDLHSRAFWNPPHSAAYFERGHRRYFIVPQDEFPCDLEQRRA